MLSSPGLGPRYDVFAAFLIERTAHGEAGLELPCRLFAGCVIDVPNGTYWLVCDSINVTVIGAEVSVMLRVENGIGSVITLTGLGCRGRDISRIRIATRIKVITVASHAFACPGAVIGSFLEALFIRNHRVTTQSFWGVGSGGWVFGELLGKAEI
jgi:hypothetical protein